MQAAFRQLKVHMGAAENFTHRSCEAGSVPAR